MAFPKGNAGFIVCCSFKPYRENAAVSHHFFRLFRQRRPDPGSTKLFPNIERNDVSFGRFRLHKDESLNFAFRLCDNAKSASQTQIPSQHIPAVRDSGWIAGTVQGIKRFKIRRSVRAEKGTQGFLPIFGPRPVL
jgi:hypothetical protein